jgi:hypothetical protein
MVVWQHTMTSEWKCAEHRQRCIECGQPATFRLDAQHPVSRALHTQWRCTNHAAAFAYERGLAFPPVSR